MKFLLKFFVVLTILVLVLLYNLVSTYPITKPNALLTPEQVATAKRTLSGLLIELRRNDPTLQVVITQNEVDVLSDLAAHTVKHAGFETYISNQALTAATSVKLPITTQSWYLNLYCTFAPVYGEFRVDHCKIGNIPINSSISESLLQRGLKSSLTTEAFQLVISLFRKVQLQNESLVLVAPRPDKLRTVLVKSIRGDIGKGSSLPFAPTINPSSLIFYLDLLQRSETPGASLPFYIGRLFEAAHARTQGLEQQGLTSAALQENQHALWALAAYFGNSRFSKLVGVTELRNYKGSYIPTLSGRTDLTLHFLYSVVLDQLGGGTIGLGIGELKELDDANKGGSGYSFADLAADKAGLRFSQFLTSDEQSAKNGQRLLATSLDPNIYFPDIAELPEGLKGDSYAKVIDNLESEQYKVLTRLIDQRIAALPLYQTY